MSPSLHRIDDASGSSAGWWAVAALPGVILYQQDRDRKEWSFYCYPAAMQPDTPWGKSVHPNEEIAAQAEEFLYQSGLAAQRFPTRKAALQALKIAQEIF